MQDTDVDYKKILKIAQNMASNTYRTMVKICSNLVKCGYQIIIQIAIYMVKLVNLTVTRLGNLCICDVYIFFLW